MDFGGCGTLYAHGGSRPVVPPSPPTPHANKPTASAPGPTSRDAIQSRRKGAANPSLSPPPSPGASTAPSRLGLLP